MNIIETAYARFSKQRITLPTEAQVRALEREIKTDFPPDYRTFVLNFNGGYFTEPEITPVGDGCPQDALSYLFGIDALHPGAELGDPKTLDLFEDNDPPKTLPIGATALGGLIILDSATGVAQSS